MPRESNKASSGATPRREGTSLLSKSHSDTLPAPTTLSSHTSGTASSSRSRVTALTRQTSASPAKPASSAKLSKSQENIAVAGTGALRASRTQPGSGNTGVNGAKPRSKTPNGLEKTPLDDNLFLKPKGTPIRARGAGISARSNLKKSSSYQSITKERGTGSELGKEARHGSTQNIFSDKTASERNRIAVNSELLSRIEREKKQYESRISELIQVNETRKMEIEKMTFEIKNLKESLEKHDAVCDELKMENALLRTRLTEMGVAPENITDTDKLTSRVTIRKKVSQDGAQFDSQSSSSTPDHGSTISDNMSSVNWDHLSLKSGKSDAVSGISVANLQDRILQMQEDNYSTTEELQATLLELGDLQRNLDDLNEENNGLGFERAVLLESLCQQTQKLEQCRMQIDNLKFLLLTDKSTNRSDRENKYCELYSTAEVDKKDLYVQNQELTLTIESLEDECRVFRNKYLDMKERFQQLEVDYEKIGGDLFTNVQVIEELKVMSADDKRELQRYKVQLEHEKVKVSELEAARDSKESDVQKLLSKTLHEKERLEKTLSELQDECTRSLKEREKAAALEKELKMNQDQTETMVNSFTSQLQDLETDRDSMKHQNFELRQRLEVREKEGAVVADLKKQLEEGKSEIAELKSSLYAAHDRYEKETSEWKLYEQDLLKTVQVADTIRAESEEEMKKMSMENQSLKEQTRKLGEELSRLQSEVQLANRASALVPGSSPAANELRGRVISSADRELANLRTTRQPQPSTVKCLIHSIEEQVKAVNSPRALASPPRVTPGSPTIVQPPSPATLPRRASTHSPVSALPVSKTTSTTAMGAVVEEVASPPTPSAGATGRRSSLGSELPIRSKTMALRTPYTSAPLSDEVKDAIPPAVTTAVSSLLSVSRRNSVVPSTPTPPPVDRRDPLSDLVKQTGGSKRNALLHWCQTRTKTYKGIDITNFSSSWNDGLALCAILHTYLPENIPYADLVAKGDKRRNFKAAFDAAETEKIPTTLSIAEMLAVERPDWNAVMGYVTSIYKHFEADART